jgi:hypothetical protein
MVNTVAQKWAFTWALGLVARWKREMGSILPDSIAPLKGSGLSRHDMEDKPCQD